MRTTGIGEAITLKRAEHYVVLLYWISIYVGAYKWMGIIGLFVLLSNVTKPNATASRLSGSAGGVTKRCSGDLTALRSE